MCLTIDPVLSRKHSSLKTNKTHTFYKVFEILNGELTTFFINSKIDNNAQIIELKNFFIDVYENEIHAGVFHAYTTKTYSNISGKYIILIPITVESNDIVAFGINCDVCFTKYKISKQSWKLIHKQIKKTKDLYYQFSPAFR
jgi:hypothetical protein